MTVTHALAHVKPNGLPESDYNDSLISLDTALTSPFRDETNGLIALIETFAGRRTYYVYLSPSFDAAACLRDVKARFPQEDLSLEVDDDPAWRLFRGYARDFHFA
jgi:hypothetical protein